MTVTPFRFLCFLAITSGPMARAEDPPPQKQVAARVHVDRSSFPATITECAISFDVHDEYVALKGKEPPPGAAKVSFRFGEKPIKGKFSSEAGVPGRDMSLKRGQGMVTAHGFGSQFELVDGNVFTYPDFVELPGEKCDYNLYVWINDGFHPLHGDSPFDPGEDCRTKLPDTPHFKRCEVIKPPARK